MGMDLLQAILGQSGAAMTQPGAGGAFPDAAPAGAAAGGETGLGGILELIREHPQILTAALALLNPKDTSVGGSNGLADLSGLFGQMGLGDVMSSWVGTGQNQPIDPQSLSNALGADTMGQFADSAGIDSAQAAPLLSSLLPGLVNQLTPQGEVPQGSDLDDALTSLMGQLGSK